MSVPSYRRKTSEMEFYKIAEKINDDVMDLVSRDFGKKRKVLKYEVLNKNISITDDDVEEINKILERNNTNIEEIKYARTIPKWMVEFYREQLLTLVSSLLLYIERGNTMYPNNFMEFMMREIYFKKAIGTCISIEHVIIRISRFVKIPFKKFEFIINDLSKEKMLLKGVIKKDKEKFKDFYNLIENDENYLKIFIDMFESEI